MMTSCSISLALVENEGISSSLSPDEMSVGGVTNSAFGSPLSSMYGQKYSAQRSEVLPSPTLPRIMQLALQSMYV
jgi:hypothetical protein